MRNRGISPWIKIPHTLRRPLPGIEATLLYSITLQYTDLHGNFVSQLHSFHEHFLGSFDPQNITSKPATIAVKQNIILIYACL